MDNRRGNIERGVVISASGGKYVLSSLDRDGIETPPLLPLMSEDTFSVGDIVCYFYFNDGSGRVICSL